MGSTSTLTRSWMTLRAPSWREGAASPSQVSNGSAMRSAIQTRSRHHLCAWRARARSYFGTSLASAAAPNSPAREALTGRRVLEGYP